MSFSLKLLGGVALEGSAGPVSGPAVQRHRLALLALLAVSRPAAQSREKLVAWLWSEQDDDHARALLNQSVHALRRALGAEVILSAGNELRLNSALVRCDATAFEEAIHAEAPARAVALYSGPFLDGFFLDKAPEFERWVARERDRLETLYARALEDLAEAAQRAGDWSEAARCWKARLVHDPCDSRVVLRLMAALEREGNPAGALRHGLAHQHRLREDLEIEPDPAVLDAVARLRRESQAAPSHGENQGPLGAPPPAAAILPVASGPPSADSAASRSTRRPEAFVAAAVLLVLALVVAVGLMPGGGLRAKPATAGVDEIAQAVALELNRREQGDTTGRLPELRTTSIPAYELYLRGNDPALLRSDSAARRGLGYFEQAVALDSNYAAAWAGVARLRYRVSSGAPIAERSGLRTIAEAAARKAVTLDPNLADGYGILGMFRTMARDFPAAEAHLRRAVALEPTRAGFREWLSNFLLLTGRIQEAVAEAERAVALDPLSPSAHAELARALIADGRCDQAVVHLTRVLTVDPPLLRAAPLVAQCHGRMGQWAEAISAVRPQAERGDPLAMAFTGYLYARSGQRAMADSIHAQLEARVLRGEEGAYYLAFVPAALGDRDQAFKRLDQGVEDGSFGFPSSRSVPFTDPLFDDLRSDPRYQRFRSRYLTPP